MKILVDLTDLLVYENLDWMMQWFFETVSFDVLENDSQ